ncbi:MAG: flippase [Steroidobacteraceae bacterium]
MSVDGRSQRFIRALSPQGASRYIRGRPMLRRLLGSGVWRLGDSVFRMGAAVLVNAYVARYLSPAGFGLLSFAAAMATLVTAIAQFGMQTVVVRELIRRPQERAQILGSALVLRLVAGAASVALAVGATELLRPGDHRADLVVLIVAAIALPRAWDVIDYDYQSRIEARPVVLTRNISFVAFALLRPLLVLMHAPLEAFAFALTGEGVLATVLLLGRWRRDGLIVGVDTATWAELRELVVTSWPLVIAGLSMIVYMRIDQIMLASMVGDAGVGLFSAAVKVSEALYFIPTAAMATVAPALTAALRRSRAEHERQTLQVMRILVWIALAVAVVFACFSRLIILKLYGPAYAPAAAVLSIHAWIGVLMSINCVAGQWLVNEGYFHCNMYQTLTGAAANIALNLLLIPTYGIIGAALASCAGQFVSVMLMPAVIPKTRPLFKLQLAAFVPLEPRWLLSLLSR